MTNKTFKVVGITSLGDSTKVRFANDMIRRIKQFTKGGANRADFIELPNEMNKLDALKYMAAHRDFQNPNDQATIADCIADREKEVGKGTVKVKVEKKAKPSVEAIKTRAKKAKAVEPAATSEVVSAE